MTKIRAALSRFSSHLCRGRNNEKRTNARLRLSRPGHDHRGKRRGSRKVHGRCHAGLSRRRTGHIRQPADSAAPVISEAARAAETGRQNACCAFFAGTVRHCSVPGIYLLGPAAHQRGGRRTYQQRGPRAHRAFGLFAAARKDVRQTCRQRAQCFHRHSGRQPASFSERRRTGVRRYKRQLPDPDGRSLRSLFLGHEQSRLRPGVGIARDSPDVVLCFHLPAAVRPI